MFFFLLHRFASPHYTSLWILFLNKFSLGWVGCCSLFYLFIFYFCFVFLFFSSSFVTFTLKQYFSLVWIVRSAYCVCVSVYRTESAGRLWWAWVVVLAMYFAVSTIHCGLVYAVTKCMKHNDRLNRLHVVYTATTHNSRNGSNSTSAAQSGWMAAMAATAIGPTLNQFATLFSISWILCCDREKCVRTRARSQSNGNDCCWWWWSDAHTRISGDFFGAAD